MDFGIFKVQDKDQIVSVSVSFLFGAIFSEFIRGVLALRDTFTGFLPCELLSMVIAIDKDFKGHHDQVVATTSGSDDEKERTPLRSRDGARDRMSTSIASQ